MSDIRKEFLFLRIPFFYLLTQLRILCIDLFISASGHGICTNLRIILYKLIIHIKLLKSKVNISL